MNLVIRKVNVQYGSGIMRIIRKIYRELRPLIKIIFEFPKVFKFLFDDKNFHPYFPDEPQKNKFIVFYENLKWFFKYGEINKSI